MTQPVTDPAIAGRLLSQATGVLFDFNGTISLDEDLFAEIYMAASRDMFGIELTQAEYDRRCLGRSDIEIVVELSNDAGRPELSDALLDRVAEHYAAAVRAEPRIPQSHADLVNQLAAAGKRIAVITGSLHRLVEPALAAAGLADAVEFVLTAVDVEHGKPHPEGFLRAAERLGLPADQLVGVEDSPPGLEALSAAGIAAIDVAPGGCDLAEVRLTL